MDMSSFAPPQYPAPWVRKWLGAPNVQLFAGFLIGTAGGTLAGLFAPGSSWTAIVLAYVVHPLEWLFLQLLFLLILPLLFSAIVSGIARLRNQVMVQRLLLTTLAYMAAASIVAALIGMAMANLFRPGDGISPDIGRRLLAAGQRGGAPISATGRFPLDLHGLDGSAFGSPFFTLSHGHLPGLILLSLLLGIGLTLVRSRGSAHLLATTEGLYEVGMRLVGTITRFAPIAVACFLFDLTMVFGWHLLVSLSAYVSVVIVALLIQIFVVFTAITWILGGVQPLVFLRAVQEAALIAFATSSSNATLPTSLKVADIRLKLPPRVARLILGVGTVANQGGTAIYTGATVLFLAQFFGTELGIGQQAIVFGVSALAGMGTIGVPAGSLPIVAATLALLGLPPECIGLVVGVDRLLDMMRTVVNVIGDLAIAVAMSRKAA